MIKHFWDLSGNYLGLREVQPGDELDHVLVEDVDVRGFNPVVPTGMGQISQIPCVAILTANATGLLTTSRRGDATQKGMPGGKADPGESLEEAARREFHEETGLRLAEIWPVYAGWCEGPNTHFTVTFMGEVLGEIPAEPYEVEKGITVALGSWQDIYDGPFGQYNRAVCASLARGYDRYSV